MRLVISSIDATLGDVSNATHILHNAAAELGYRVTKNAARKVVLRWKKNGVASFYMKPGKGEVENNMRQIASVFRREGVVLHLEEHLMEVEKEMAKHPGIVQPMEDESEVSKTRREAYKHLLEVLVGQCRFHEAQKVLEAFLPEKEM